jgi:putative transposase
LIHTVSYRRHRFPTEVIQHAAWLYFRFPLRFHDVEDTLAQRGVDVCHETVRRWSVKFDLAYAIKFRRHRVFFPSAVVTDNLPSYGAALSELG